MSIANTNDLRRMLVETIQGVRDGSIDTGTAKAIACLSSTILHSAKLDLDVLRFRSEHRDSTLPKDGCMELVSGEPAKTVTKTLPEAKPQEPMSERRRRLAEGLDPIGDEAA